MRTEQMFPRLDTLRLNHGLKDGSRQFSSARRRSKRQGLSEFRPWAIVKLARPKCPVWVKSGKAHTEQTASAFTPLATFEQTCRDVGLVPILLQKDFRHRRQQH